MKVLFIEKLEVKFVISREMTDSGLADVIQALECERLLRTRLRPLSQALSTAIDWIVNHPDTTVEECKNDLDISINVRKTTNKLVYLLRT